MATVASSITKIRRKIDDEGSTVFSDARLLRIYNQERRKFFQKTMLRVRGACLANPSHVMYGLSFEWERGQISGSSWMPFFLEPTSFYMATQRWEIQEIAGITPDVSGGYCASNGCEVLDSELVNQVAHALPRDFYMPLFLGWDRNTLKQRDQSWVEDYDIDWRERQAGRADYLVMDRLGESFYPFPVPTTESDTTAATDHPVDPDGLEDTTWLDEIEDTDDSFTFFFVSVPADISATSETDVLPRPFRKYLEFRVAARALRAETELKDREKSQYYDMRGLVGEALIKRLRGVLRMDRTHVLEHLGDDRIAVRMRRPRFPDGYPKVW